MIYYKMTDWIAGMAHVNHEHREYYVKYIENRFTEYLIAWEKSPKGIEHIHYILKDEDGEELHRKMVQNVFRNKLKLRGKAGKKGTNKPRQYGRIKEIENLKRLFAYTVKDNNCDYKIEDMNVIKEALETSFKKNDNYAKLESILEEYLKLKETVNRNDLGKFYVKEYFKIFARVPTRNMIINMIVKYDEKNGVDWYYHKIGLVEQHGDQYCDNDYYIIKL